MNLISNSHIRGLSTPPNRSAVVVSKAVAVLLPLVPLVCFLLSPADLAAQQALAITNGQVITGAGETLESGTVVIRDGKIVAVGADVDVPLEAKVIDAKGKVVMPGFVDAHNSDGMSQANETNPNVPYVSVLDSIDPMRSYFDDSRRNGVTTVGVIPGNSTMIGGQGAVIKTGGSFLDDMVLKRTVGLKLSLRPQGGSSRMAHYAALRKELDEAREMSQEPAAEDQDEPQGESAAEKGDEGESGEESEGDSTAGPAKDQDDDSDDDADDADDDEDEDEDDDEDDERERELKQAVIDLVKGQLRGFIYCEGPNDVRQALALVESYELNAILVLGKDCYKAAEMIAESGLPVILDSELVFWETDPRTEESRRVVLTQVFDEAEVGYAFQSARPSSNTIGTNYLWYQAATAVKYGLDRNRAIEALTIVPAKILGVDEFVGSLEVGKDGDAIILTGDPLSTETWVDTTIVRGQVVYERDKDPKLKRLLEGPAQ